MNKKELKRLVTKAIENQEAYVASCRSCDVSGNPQVIVERLKAEGMVEALDAVSDALKNYSVLLKILADEK